MDSCNNENSKKYVARLSSKWIKYDDNMTTWTNLFRLQVKDSNNYKLNVVPQICDQLGFCSDTSLDYIEDDGLNAKLISFRMLKPMTDRFRLVFVFHLTRLCSRTKLAENFAAKFSLIHFGDPCYQVELRQVVSSGKCLNDGRCHANVYQNLKQTICQCAQGYSGDNCEQIDSCNQPVNSQEVKFLKIFKNKLKINFSRLVWNFVKTLV